MDIQHIFTAEGLVMILSLTVMEIILGIDNILFVAIVSGKLPKEQQSKARFIGLSLALIIRVLLLFTITWIIGMKAPLFTIMEYNISFRNLILFVGGLFLIYKTTTEIHHKLEGGEDELHLNKLSFTSAIIQILFLDVVFSFDSILTAIGVANDQVLIMVIAVVASLFVMLAFSRSVSDFINKHPSIKMLALSFLLMIGFILIAEGMPDEMHVHLPKGTLFFAMGFTLAVELNNMRRRRRRERALKLKDNIAQEYEKMNS